MEFLTPPWKHQLEAIERAKDAPHFALFFDPGTGKTGTAINILRHQFKEAGRILRTLILCPPIVISNWKDEFAKHSKVDPHRIHLLTGSGPKRARYFMQQAFDHARKPIPQIFVTNYEALLMDPLFHALQEWAPEILIVDESQKIRNPTARRTRRTDLLANPSDKKTKITTPRPKVYLLSGSPILNHAIDIFSQFLVLDGGETFGGNFFAFRSRYFRDKNAGMPTQRHFPDWVPHPGSLDAISTLIAKKGMRVAKEDCLDLPPLVKQTIRVKANPKQAQVYEDMRKHLVAYLDGDTCVAQLAVTKMLRLLQIASGFYRTDEDKDIQLEENPKLGTLSELLETIAPDHKVIVWAVFKENYKMIRSVCQKLDLPFVELHGEIDNVQKMENVKRFNEDPAIRVCIGHPASGGIGVNLVAASYAIWFSRTFSLEDRIQSEARNFRSGSEIHQKITQIDLVMEGSVEEACLKALDRKTDLGISMLKELIQAPMVHE